MSKWLDLITVLAIVLFFFLLIACATQAHTNDLPPDIPQLRHITCSATQDGAKFRAVATAQYSDGRPEWKRMLSLRGSMDAANKDCMNLYKQVVKASKSAK